MPIIFLLNQSVIETLDKKTRDEYTMLILELIYFVQSPGIFPGCHKREKRQKLSTVNSKSSAFHQDKLPLMWTV